MQAAEQPHVFISYSRADGDFVSRLIGKLTGRGIPVWIDQQGLIPGTPDWEQALRDAIRKTRAVLLIASPNSRKSRYVKDELRIAEMYQCPVYPIWADGDEWMDSIPMGWGGTQNIDARGERFAMALDRIVSALGSLQVPKTASQPAEPDFEPRNPYKGLNPFRPEDCADFFGREKLVETLVDDLAHTLTDNRPRFLAILGPSGSGKSSVMMAGLLPRLQSGAVSGSDNWFYLNPVVPGARPVENLTIMLSAKIPGTTPKGIREVLDDSPRGLHLLASQLDELASNLAKRPRSRVLLMIDQFEELFTQTVSDAERQAFIDLLVGAVTEPGGPLVVVTTLRADFFDRPMHYPDLGRLVDMQHATVMPLSLDDLRSVIEKPAGLSDVQLRFEGNLVGDLLYEVYGQPGALPLLQFTLDQLFQRRDKRLLTRTAYTQMGGVRGALAKHADSTYLVLPSDAHRQMAQALFLRLIEPGVTEQDTTRRRAPLSELVLPDPTQTRILRETADGFVRARLLTAGEVGGTTTIEVSHEALIREWPLLADWLSTARDDIRLQRAISADATEWIRQGKSKDYAMFYRGAALTDAQTWAKRGVPSADEAAFLEASIQAEVARRARDEAIARRVQNFGRAAAILGVVGLLAVLVTIFAASQAFSARSEVDRANQFIVTAQTQVAVVGQTLTPAQSRLNEANAAVADAQQNALMVAQTLTPVPMTLTPVQQTLAAGNTQIAAAQAKLVDANAAAQAAQTQVAVAGTAQRQALADAKVAQAQALTATIAQGQAVAQAGAAQQTVIAVGATLTPVRATLQMAQAQVTSAALTLIPIPDTLTPVRQTLQAGERSLATAAYQANQANKLAAAAAQTLTPIPVTLTLVQQTLQAGNDKLALAQRQVAAAGQTLTPAAAKLDQANAFVMTAQTQIAIVGQTLTPIPLTLTPAQVALQAGNDRLATAQTQIAAVGQTLTPAKQQIDQANSLVVTAQNQAIAAQQTLAPVPITLTAVAAQIADGNQQIESIRLAAAANKILADPLATDKTPAVLLSLRALRTHYDAQADLALQNALATLFLKHQFLLPGDAITDAVFSPDDTTIITGSKNGKLQVWDAATGRELRTMTTTGTISRLALYPDGKLLAVGIASLRLELWDWATGEKQRVLIQDINNRSPMIVSMNVLAIAPSGRTLLIDNVLRDAQNGAVITSLYNGNGNQTKILAAAFSPNGNTIVTANDSYARLWYPRGALIRSFAGHTGTVTSLAFSPDGKTLLTGSQDKTVRLWNVMAESGAALQTYSGHTDMITTVAFAPDGATFATASSDKTIKVWNVTTGRINLSIGLDKVATRVKFSHDGHTILAMREDDTVQLFSTINQMSARNVLAGHTSTINDVAFSPDGKTVLTGSGDGTARLWEASSGQIQHTFSNPPSVTSDILSVAFSPDGKTILTGDWKNLRLWDVSSEQPLRTFEQAARIVSVAFSPDGKTILSDDSNNTARLWDTATGHLLQTLTHPNPVMSVSFSPDGKTILTGSSDSIARLWDAASGQLLRTLAGHTDYVTDVAFSPDGKTILTGSEDKTARLWDAASGQLLRTLVGHTDYVTGVAFSPDSKTILTASKDKTVRLWTTATGALLRTIAGQQSFVRAVFAPDGATILTADSDNVARIWDVDYRVLSALACTRIFRDLTSDEKVQYGITDDQPTCRQFTSPGTP